MKLLKKESCQDACFDVQGKLKELLICSPSNREQTRGESRKKRIVRPKTVSRFHMWKYSLDTQEKIFSVKHTNRDCGGIPLLSLILLSDP